MIADYTGFHPVPLSWRWDFLQTFNYPLNPVLLSLSSTIFSISTACFQLLPLLMLLFKCFKATIGFYAGGTIFIVILVAMFFACIGVLIAYAHFLTRAQYRTDYDRRLWVAAVSSRPNPALREALVYGRFGS